VTTWLCLASTASSDFRAAARRHDRRFLPGAVCVSTDISTTAGDIDRLLDAVRAVATTPAPIEYVSDPASGDYRPKSSGHRAVQS
jgi:hypothetical protein